MTGDQWAQWDQAQDAEKGHWLALWQPDGSTDRDWIVEHESQKGDFIFEELTKHFKIDPVKDWANKSVLDVGCGPVSLVARGKYGKTRTGVDPLRYPHWVYEAYSKNDFKVILEPFEEFHNPSQYDVVIFYNALQHFADLAAVARRTKEILAPGGRAYLAEYLEVPTNEAHIQYLEKTPLDKLFAAADFTVDSAVKSVRLEGLVERPGGQPIDLYLAQLS